MNQTEPIATVSGTGHRGVWETLTTAVRSIRELITWPPYEPDVQIASWALPPHPFSVPKARRLIRARLTAWELEGFNEVIELLVSELVTNALHHAPGPIRLTLWFTGGMLRCEVEDTSTEPPKVHENRVCDMYDEGGRGLYLLDMLACCWGSIPTSRGKGVWFELPTSATFLKAG
ncbi:ATP-binding protein [Streptosporangium canum]|uniref:ATP-binding protein n=1 Tax=Streptosporangium canum TaxID=324952 RepID=UPI0037B9CE91